MNQLQNIFDYNGIQLRTVIKNGEPWFVARDVCDVLKIVSPTRAVANLNENQKGIHKVKTLGGEQDMLVINEPGLYKMVFRSNKVEAEKFTDWVTSEVIPSIRKHGAYMTPEKVEEVLLNPDTIIQLATQLKQERESKLQLAAKIEHDKPKVIFAEALEISKNSILVGELAKLLKQNGVDIGQNRLFEWLRKEGYLGNKGEYYNLPTQKSMEMSLFEIKVTTVNNPDGSVRVTKTPKVTGKGQIYFINKFKQELVGV